MIGRNSAAEPRDHIAAIVEQPSRLGYDEACQHFKLIVIELRVVLTRLE
jgi:hypothetical protein